MKDLFGEVNPTKQALYEHEQKRLNRKYVPMAEGEGELFAGPWTVQLSIEDAAPEPVPLADEDSKN